MIHLNDTFCEPWLHGDTFQSVREQIERAHANVWDSRRDAEYKGWLRWPEADHTALFREIAEVAERFKACSEVTVVVGIGGSYLGAKAAISVCRPSFLPQSAQRVVFAGHHLSSAYHAELLRYLDAYDVTLVVVSKSGSTIEPSAAFHLLRTYLQKRYGVAGARVRTCAITDPVAGALSSYATAEGYAKLPIPADVGGRFSGLTAVGLLPMALCGISLEDVLAGARAAMTSARTFDLDNNASLRYAAVRHALYEDGFSVEALVTYYPEVASFAAWWQQLFGESQGKDGKGLFPTTLQYTTDLHAMGQYVQEARRLLFETVLDFQHVESTTEKLSVPNDVDQASEMLSGRTFDALQEIALASVVEAHASAGVPNIILQPVGKRESIFGELVYFFEHACAVGGYLLGVQPFNQPGVEAYKQLMMRRLR